MNKEVKYNFVLNSFNMQYMRPQLYASVFAAAGEKVKESSLGTPVFDTLIIADNLENPTVQVEIDTALIDAELPKLIKKTAVTGRDGRVKEYIADDDWRLIIRGAVFSEVKDTYPETAIRKLKKLAKIPNSLEVASLFLNELLGVDTIVIERLQLTQRVGMMNAQAFQITASSDMPYELKKEIDNA